MVADGQILNLQSGPFPKMFLYKPKLGDGVVVKLFREKEGVLRKVSDTHSVINLLTAEDSNRISVAVGIGDKMKETTTARSDRVYYILEGELTINDEIIGRAGDVIFVSEGTTYTMEGAFRAVTINSPPFKKP